MEFESFVEGIQRARGYEGQIAHVRVTPAGPPTYADLDVTLHPAVQSILSSLGIRRLYSHQAEAIAASLNGEHVCVVASTAGGKTLCYTIPLAQRLCERPTSRAFLIFPTKALAQDQLRKLGPFGADRAFTAACFDGDTPQTRRRAIKREAQVVLTNPDMLHVSILPYHHTWADFFRNLRFVVLDEVHTYRGVFGSHTANVIRRLRRVAAAYGSQPQFICCSATIGNPEELTRKLVGLPVRVIDRDGAPRGKRIWVFWNPPMLKDGSGRRSALIESATLLCRLVERGVRTIDFTLTRKTAELIVRHAHRFLGRNSPLARAVMAYRAGYLPEERRDLEKRLFEGSLLGVVSTSALELGIDIGHLQAVILTGYPGTIASTFQQAGRAGRGHEDSLIVLIAQESAIDQYIMQHPDFLFRAESERCLIDPENRFVVGAHLLCAAYERELADHELALFAPDAEEILQRLAEDEGRWVAKRTKWYYVSSEYVPKLVSLRSAGGDAFDIRDLDHENALIGTVDARSAFTMVHEGAVYMHMGETYLVRKLDLRERTAYVQQKDVDYYTDAMTESQVLILQESESAVLGGGVTKHLGEVSVVEHVVGYIKRMPGGRGLQDSEPLDLPEAQYETVGLWLAMPASYTDSMADRGYDVAGALHAVEHTLVALTPVVAPCDVRDIGGVSYSHHHELNRPALFLYDGYPGGVGICEAAYDRLDKLLAAAWERVSMCPCESGCPACVQSPFCGSMNRPLDKGGALMLLGQLVELLKEQGARRDGC